MESLTLNVRVNANDKEQFEQFCSSVGMNASTAVNMFIKAVLREQRLPFEISSKSFEDYAYFKIKEAEDNLKNGGKLYSEEEVYKRMDDIIGD